MTSQVPEDLSQPGEQSSKPNLHGHENSASEPNSKLPRWTHRLGLPLRLLITFASLYLIVQFLLIPDLHQNKNNFHHLIHIDFRFLILGVALEIASLMSYAKLTQVVLPGKKLKLHTLWRIDMSTFALSHLVPGGTVAGTALGYRLLDAQGVSYTDATFALGAQGIGSALVLNVIFWAALIITIPLHGFGPNLGYLYRTAALVGVLLLSLAGGLIFFLTIGQQRASRVIRWLAKRIPFLDSVRFERVLRQLADHLAALAKDRSLLVRAIAWAATNWGLDAASLWVFMRAFGDSVLVPYLLVAYGLAYVLAAIPITPGGLGIVEYVLIAILQGFGFKNAALGVLCYRLVNFLLPIPVGGISYLSLTVHKAVTDSRAESPAGAIERNSMRPSNRISGIRGDIKDELREAVVIARRDSEHLDQWAHRYGVSSPVHLNREPRHSATEQVHPDQADRPADPPDSDDGSSTGP